MRCGLDRNEAVVRHERCGLSLMMEGPAFGKDGGWKQREMIIVRKGQITKGFSGFSFTQILDDSTTEQTQRRTR